MSEYKQVENRAVYVPVSELHLLENNPRVIKKEKFEKLKNSVNKFRYYFEGRPCLVNEVDGLKTIFAGNQRFRAAKELGWESVPAVVYHNLSEDEQKELTIRDNVELGEWDWDILANDWDADLLAEWGVDDVKPFKEIVEDDPEPLDEDNTYSVIGDIYQLGEHRIFCGSFEDDEKVRELFGGKKAICTFTDPPYNVAVKNRSTGKTIQNDNMSHEDFQNFLNRAFECVASNTVDGGGV